MSDVLTTETHVFFWGGWPSQWFKSRFTVDGVQYATAEQFMMAEKARVFGDTDAAKDILRSRNPREQKEIGRRVRKFDADTWNSVCRGVVYTGNLAKFTQNDDLRELLLATGERTIVEASPKDAIWGIGLIHTDPRVHDPAQWLGTNWLGIAIEQVRKQLRSDANHATSLGAELQKQLDIRERLR
ncbi:MAG: NADAR family protein [Phycisphaerales bacterium]